MNKNDIHGDLLPLRFIRPMLWRPLLPFMNAFLLMAPRALSREQIIQRRVIAAKPNGAFPAVIIKPPGVRSTAPCLIYFHGGAFVLKAASHHYSLAERFAIKTPCVVILPDYRLAPRYPFPIPAEDCFCAYKWTIANAEALGIDPERIAVGGDSAGGALAAAVCLMARDRNTPLPCFQMLIYPVTDRRMGSASMRLFVNTPMWNARLNKKMWKCYLPAPDERNICYASPMEAHSLIGLPGTYLETAELDALRDEGIAYAEALRDAGVFVRLVQVNGAFHGFDLMKNSLLVKECINLRVTALIEAFCLKD